MQEGGVDWSGNTFIPDYTGPSDPGGLQDFAASLNLPEVPAYTPPSIGYQPGATGTTPGPQAPAGAPSLLEDFASGLRKEVTGSPLKTLATGLGLGATALNFANQGRVASSLADQTAQIRKSQVAASAAAAPAVSAGTADVQRAQAGQLQPAMEASIAQWAQQAKADIRARYASMGLGNSSDLQGQEAKIDQMALAMKGQLLQSEEALGLEGLQTGVSAATGVSQVAAQQQQLLAGLIQQANQALGLLGGRTA